MKVMRAFALIGVLGFSFLAAGCGGQSGATPPVAVQQDPLSSPVTDSAGQSDIGTMSTTAASSFTLKASVISADGSKFVVRTVSPSCGTMYVYYTRATTKFYPYLGYPVKVGMPIEATGTGSCRSGGSMTAKTVTYTAAATPPPTTPTSSTTSSPAATPPPGPPSAGVPKHVQTAEYLLTATEETSSPSRYAPYLTYAYTSMNRLGVTQASGIKTVIYSSAFQPNGSLYELGALRTSYSGAEAKTCSGSTIVSYGGSGLLTDPEKGAFPSYFANVVSHYAATARAANPGYAQPWNYIFMDNDGPLYHVSGTPCDYNLSSWTSHEDAAMAASGQHFVLNGLSVAPSDVPTFVNRLAPSYVSGGQFELCYVTSLWSV